MYLPVRRVEHDSRMREMPKGPSGTTPPNEFIPVRIEVILTDRNVAAIADDSRKVDIATADGARIVDMIFTA